MGLLTLRRTAPSATAVAPNYPGSAAPGNMQAVPYGMFVGPDHALHYQFDLATEEVSDPIQSLTWAAGQRLAPVGVIHANYLESYELHVQLAGTIDQVASETQRPAIAPNGLGAVFASVRQVLSGQDNPVDLTGRWLPVRQAAEVHSFVDTSNVVMPALNTTTGAVTGNWSIDAILRVPVALSLKTKPGDWSPRGLLMVQNDSVSANLFLTCGELTDFISVESGETVNLTSGTVEIRQNGMTIPADPYSAPDLSELHTMETYQETVVQGTRTRVPILTGDVYTRLGFAILLPSGQVDAANTSGLATVTVRYGGQYRKEDQLSPDSLRYRQATRDGAAVYPGFYVFDWSRDWPRNTFDSGNVTDFRLELGFNAAPEAGTLVEVFKECLVPAA